MTLSRPKGQSILLRLCRCLCSTQLCAADSQKHLLMELEFLGKKMKSRVDYGRRAVSQPPVSRSPSPNRACTFRYALGSLEIIA